MDEEKQLENTQKPEAGLSSKHVAQVETKPMSAETNSPIDPQAQLNNQLNNPDAEQAAAAAPEEFTLEPDIEPFDLTPDSSVAEPPSTEQSTTLKPTVEELTQRVEALKSQLENQDGLYKRLAADFENYRKRTQKEKEEQEQVVKCATVKELLPVVDNFERARAQIKPQTDAEMNIHKSYQGVYKQFVDALKKIGVSPMRSEGKEFDPNLHEAVLREPTHEFDEGTVIEELVRGYMLGERVLRHAMVKVAAAPEEDAPASSEAEPSA